MLGTRPDDEVGSQIGKTHSVVRIKRRRFGIPNPVGRRKHGLKKKRR